MKRFQGSWVAGALVALFALGWAITSCEAQIDLSCTVDTDCFEDVGYVCDLQTNTCLKGCAVDGDCIDSEYCDVTVCRFSTNTGTGGGGGGGGGAKSCVQCETVAHCNNLHPTMCEPEVCECTNGVCVLTNTCSPACDSDHYCTGITCANKCDGDLGAATPQACADATKPICHTDGICYGCVDSNDCAGGDKSKCNTDLHICVCNNNGECDVAGGDPGERCFDWGCGCVNASQCTAGTGDGYGDTCGADGHCTCVDDGECTAAGLLGCR